MSIQAPPEAREMGSILTMGGKARANLYGREIARVGPHWQVFLPCRWGIRLQEHCRRGIRVSKDAEP